jgi:hypothetical protein
LPKRAPRARAPRRSRPAWAISGRSESFCILRRNVRTFATPDRCPCAEGSHLTPRAPPCFASRAPRARLAVGMDRADPLEILGVLLRHVARIPIGHVERWCARGSGSPLS